MPENPEVSRARTVKLLESDILSVNRNQLNSSSSKMQYSIPKAPRFIDDNHEYNLSYLDKVQTNFMISQIPNQQDLRLLDMVKRWIWASRTSKSLHLANIL